ncbi:hypothetical protein HBH53_239440 [Parastagonospora nodorum]|nr:hypothetical protein HBH53_239440 [Parastagonospora nodorum]
MCAKDDLIRQKGPLSTSTQTWEVLFQTHDERLAGELATAESVTAKDSNYVDTFGLDFAFSFAAWLQRIKCTLGDINSLFNILSLIAFIISYRPFADELNIQQSLPDGATVVPIIISVNKTQLSLISGDIAAWPVYVTIRNLSREAQRRRSTPGTLLAEFIPTTKIRDPLLKTTDTLHLLLKGLVIKMLDFMQDMLDDIYSGKQKAIIQQLVAVVSPLFVLKAPFALHFIRAVCDLHALTHIIQDIRMYGALDNRTYSTRVTRPLLFRRLRWSILGIQPHSTKLPLSEVAANIAISDFTHAAAVCISVQIHPSIKCWQSSGKRHNDPEHCDEEVLHLILTIIDYTCYDKDKKHIAYIRAFSEVLLFNNNEQIDNTTGMLSVPFKFYDLSTIIRLVHLVLRDLPDSTTYTTMSYYVNNYIDWDEYNRLYSLTFNIDLLRTLREYRRKRIRNN